MAECLRQGCATFSAASPNAHYKIKPHASVAVVIAISMQKTWGEIHFFQNFFDNCQIMILQHFTELFKCHTDLILRHFLIFT